ncbi:IS110 family transposase [Marinobacter sp. SS13-12]|uniref:IS110 family transposase n=1 Tax=Marinobacter sp. SS13-12 TaxID=3050451 RepID=UPI0025562350|nr:IS110 family transposase [Marinobacter sp. SS13-12]MDK8463467.1 IS110 family transposase [Marinobacter sp. SS13-12]
MTLFSAIDLHSNNSVVVVIDEQDHILLQKRFPNDLSLILSALEPFRSELQSVAVESTFNWYWLVDGLLAAGIKACLVNTVAVQQYSGLKHTDDHSDAYWLAHLMRLGILPTGYIYPAEDRPLRDLLRKRLQLVRHRVTFMLSAQCQIWRCTGVRVENALIKRADGQLLRYHDNPELRMALNSNLVVLRALNAQIEAIEQRVKDQIALKPEFQLLLSVNGIGDILGQTIALETGDIKRFSTVGRYASYCRCVDSKRLSNGKSKGQNNRKNGNVYLGWAFVEAAHSIIRHHKAAHRFYQRKRAQRNGALATKALAHKLSRACYYVMRDQVPFQAERLFG